MSGTKDGVSSSMSKSFGSWMRRNSTYDRRASMEDELMSKNGGGSLSNALGDLWRGKRRRQGREEDGEDDEADVGRAGPSGAS